jgi:excisionase family DNA binding protein
MADLTYTVPEAAKQLKVSPDTVYKLISEGRFPAYRTGTGKKSGIRIPVEALVKHLTDVALAAVKPVKPVPADFLQIGPMVGRKQLSTKLPPGCGGLKKKRERRQATIG